MKFVLSLSVSLMFCFSAFAMSNTEKYAININEKIPDIKALYKEYMTKSSDYNRHFSVRWDMPDEFDTEFKSTYHMLAEDERHLSSLSENEIYKMLKKLPKEMYPYIGPYLHTLPQLSGRILEMPGIKETKNKFPQEIAERFRDIENIEYASPYLYIDLMPEDLISKLEKQEYSAAVSPEYYNLRRWNIAPEFWSNVAKRTPLSDYIADKKKQSQDDGLRHYIMTENTSLSGADIKAFADTLGNLRDFNRQNGSDFITTTFLIADWEEQQGAEKGFYLYKQIANPCHAMVRNIKWSNKTLDFQKVIGKSGFGLKDWAMVCDKTIKAYRRANLNTAMALMLYGMKNGEYMRFYEVFGLNSDELRSLRNLMEAAVEMYNAPEKDVEAVKPYMNRLYKTLTEKNSYYLGAPLIIP